MFCAIIAETVLWLYMIDCRVFRAMFGQGMRVSVRFFISLTPKNSAYQRVFHFSLNVSSIFLLQISCLWKWMEAKRLRCGAFLRCDQCFLRCDKCFLPWGAFFLLKCDKCFFLRCDQFFFEMLFEVRSVLFWDVVSSYCWPLRGRALTLW